MKIRSTLILKPVSLFLVIITVFCSSVFAQESAESEVPPPVEEIFEEVDALASPVRIGDCPYDNDFYKITNCRSIKETSYFRLDRTSLYNEDGSLWYTYSNVFDHPDFYKKNTTMDFLPFASYGDFQNNPILRMIGESENWYKVEVNEKTRATKFIAKNDSRWEKTAWSFWLAKMAFFAVNEDDETKIYDKPSGNVIGSVADSKLRYIRYLGKTEDNWAYVQAAKGVLCYPVESKSEQCYPGWIRWREGRKILVKHARKVFHVTEIKTKARK